MTKLGGLTHEQVLRELRDAGLGSLPGGGAEVFADRVRRLVAPGKEHPDNWFHVHDTAHRLGIPTHCTMLYGHVETVRGAGRPPAPAARPAGRDRRLPRVHPARVPSGEHGLRAPRLAAHDRLRRPEDDRGLAAAARQHPEHQGLLDHDGDCRSRRSRCTSARTTSRARSCARRSSTRPARGPRPSRRSTSSSAVVQRGRPHPGAARHALQRAPPVGRLMQSRHDRS